MKTPKLIRLDLDQSMIQLIDQVDHRTLGVWAADCAERVLAYFEEPYPTDFRPRHALEILRIWVQNGEFRMADIRKASLDAHAAARAVKNDDHIARLAARATGQAVATAHVPAHAIGAAIYAATAIREKTGSLEKVIEERDWQYKHLANLKKEMSTMPPAKQKLWRG